MSLPTFYMNSLVLLLGTAYTMEGDFIKGKLNREFGITVQVPEEDDRAEINRIVFEELVLGKFLDCSRDYLTKVMNQFSDIEGVILGCTELPLIIHEDDYHLPLFNTTRLHAEAAVELAYT